MFTFCVCVSSLMYDIVCAQTTQLYFVFEVDLYKLCVYNTYKEHVHCTCVWYLGLKQQILKYFYLNESLTN